MTEDIVLTRRTGAVLEINAQSGRRANAINRAMSRADYRGGESSFKTSGLGVASSPVGRTVFCAGLGSKEEAVDYDRPSMPIPTMAMAPADLPASPNIGA